MINLFLSDTISNKSGAFDIYRLAVGILPFHIFIVFAIHKHGIAFLFVRANETAICLAAWVHISMPELEEDLGAHLDLLNESSSRIC